MPLPCTCNCSPLPGHNHPLSYRLRIAGRHNPHYQSFGIRYSLMPPVPLTTLAWHWIPCPLPLTENRPHSWQSFLSPAALWLQKHRIKEFPFHLPYCSPYSSRFCLNLSNCRNRRYFYLCRPEGRFRLICRSSTRYRLPHRLQDSSSLWFRLIPSALLWNHGLRNLML